MVEKKAKKTPGNPPKRRKLAGKSIGFGPDQLTVESLPGNVSELERSIKGDGGKSSRLTENHSVANG
jgi:hypothetical protein